MPSTSKIHWPPPAEPPRLRAGDVHLWCARLDAADDAAGRFEPWLSEDERQRTRRLQFARDRQRFIAARGLLREILASYLATAAPEELRFAYGPAGKPRLAEPAAGTGLQFNLSHSGALALYAITWGEPVGVDLEAVRPMPELARIATQYFRPAESDLLRRLGPDRCLGTFFQLWTQKEALAKACGLGLAEALEPADAPVGPPIGRTIRG